MISIDYKKIKMKHYKTSYSSNIKLLILSIIIFKNNVFHLLKELLVVIIITRTQFIIIFY